MTSLWMLDMEDTSICINALAVIKDQLSFYQKKKTNKSGRSKALTFKEQGIMIVMGQPITVIVENHIGHNC